MACRENSKFSTSWYYHFRCAYPSMPNVSISMQYLQKNMGFRRFFCLQINTKVFYKVLVFWMCVTRLAQSIHNSKFVIYLQYLKENGKNEVDFLLFLECYLAVPRSTLGHSQGDILTNVMLITAFIQVRPRGHREPHNKVGLISPAERLAGFERGTCRF